MNMPAINMGGAIMRRQDTLEDDIRQRKDTPMELRSGNQ